MAAVVHQSAAQSGLGPRMRMTVAATQGALAYKNPKYARYFALTIGAYNAGIQNAAIDEGFASGAARYLAKYYRDRKVRHYMRRQAMKLDMSLSELNLTLFAVSVIGEIVTGPNRYRPDDREFDGWSQRGKVGLIFDFVDTILAYQGLPTAAAAHYLMLGDYSERISSGHSLGSLDANNIVSWGFAPSAELQAVPFTNIGTGGANVRVLSNDPISGFFLSLLFNPQAEWITRDDRQICDFEIGLLSHSRNQFDC
jgi:hypothetical protein